MASFTLSLNPSIHPNHKSWLFSLAQSLSSLQNHHHYHYPQPSLSSLLIHTLHWSTHHHQLHRPPSDGGNTASAVRSRTSDHLQLLAPSKAMEIRLMIMEMFCCMRKRERREIRWTMIGLRSGTLSTSPATSPLTRRWASPSSISSSCSTAMVAGSSGASKTVALTGTYKAKAYKIEMSYYICYSKSDYHIANNVTVWYKLCVWQFPHRLWHMYSFLKHCHKNVCLVCWLWFVEVFQLFDFFFFFSLLHTNYLSLNGLCMTTLDICSYI